MSRVLGEGTYSKVEKDAEKNIVIKTFKVANDPQAISEIAILRHLDHPHIIKLACVKLNSDGFWQIYMRAYSMNLDADWRPFVLKHPIAVISKICIDVASALYHMHKNSVIHGDIKPENILFDVRTLNAVVCDFNLAVYYPPEILPSNMQTPGYRAPEVNYDAKLASFNDLIDIWSFGCVAFRLLTNEEFRIARTNDSIACACTSFGIDTLVFNRHLVLHSMTHAQVLERLNRRIYATHWSTLNKTKELSTESISSFMEIFVGLVGRCLMPNVAVRINAESLLFRSNSLGRFYEHGYSTTQQPNAMIASRIPGNSAVILPLLQQVSGSPLKSISILSAEELAQINQRLNWEIALYDAIGPELSNWIRLLEIKYYESRGEKKTVGTFSAQLITVGCMCLIEQITCNRGNIAALYPRIQRLVIEQHAVDVFKAIGHIGIL